MNIFIRFEDNRQIETTTLENKPGGENWYETPENFDWQKSYCLTEGGKIVERSNEDIEAELLENAKSSALSSLHIYFDNHTYKYTGNSLAKAKSYQIQAKAAKNILAAKRSEMAFDEKDLKIVEPLAKVRGISAIEMAKLIQEKAKTATKAIAKYEESEDMAKKKINAAKTRKELEDFMNSFAQQAHNSLLNL